MLESRFPHYSGIGENLTWRNRPPSAAHIHQPPSFKVIKRTAFPSSMPNLTPIEAASRDQDHFFEGLRTVKKHGQLTFAGEEVMASAEAYMERVALPLHFADWPH